MQIIQHPIAVYVLPVLLAVLATYIKLICFKQTNYSIPFLLYFLVLFASGFATGVRGITAALVAIAVCTFSWLMPVTNTVGRYTIAELVLFFSEGVALILLFWWNGRWMRKLDESEQKYRRIIDQGAEALLMCDAQCNVTQASSAALRLFVRSGQELHDFSLAELVHPEERTDFELTQLRLQNQGQGSALLQQRILCGNGEWRWTECCINNLLNDPMVRGLIIQVRDITHRVNQQRHQEDFVNMASHELKSPITAIRGFLQIAEKRWQDNKRDDQPMYLSRIKAQTEKLLILIDDMLNMTRIKAGELSYHFNPIDLAVCVKDAAVAVSASTTGRELIMDIPEGLPHVNADHERIGQVVTNLLSNAFKYSPPHAPVNLSLAKVDNTLEVTVSDHGIGIPKEKLRRVFDRFYRVDTLPKGQYEGLGLGLFIASEIIRQHKGHISVESEEGKGAVFKFSLPIIML
ncbi:PAS domain-containing sensor histidine kinase [Mucilaginibacter pallidiroseus]|nr:PAS domain-containing sensor histidine kinase [Mucilaginibacter pallidiroseus]